MCLGYLSVCKWKQTTPKTQSPKSNSVLTLWFSLNFRLLLCVIKNEPSEPFVTRDLMFIRNFDSCIQTFWRWGAMQTVPWWFEASFYNGASHTFNNTLISPRHYNHSNQQCYVCLSLWWALTVNTTVLSGRWLSDILLLLHPHLTIQEVLCFDRLRLNVRWRGADPHADSLKWIFTGIRLFPGSYVRKHLVLIPFYEFYEWGHLWLSGPKLMWKQCMRPLT